MAARATVIIPTYGNAKFAYWAIKSVQNQTVKDIEICIICDGSPKNMVSFFQKMGKEDPRLKVYVFPKSPGLGEPYRDIVIRQTTGNIICYCGHDDLWLPNHIQVLEKALKKCYFTHSIHVEMNLPDNIKDENTLFDNVILINLNQDIVKRMMGRENFFGLAFVAHTRKSYDQLKEGWTIAPKDVWSDLYMWRKFLSAFGNRCKTTKKVTALKFAQDPRRDWTEQQRDEELRLYFEKVNDPIFFLQIHKNIINRVEWIDGFYGLERTKETTWRWCSAHGTLVINNPSITGKKAIINATFFTGYPELANLIIESNHIKENLKINNSGCSYRKEIIIPPGRCVIKFSCDAKQIDAPLDKRSLVFRIVNFQMVVSSFKLITWIKLLPKISMKLLVRKF